jgi:hypothetical protein
MVLNVRYREFGWSVSGADDGWSGNRIGRKEFGLRDRDRGIRTRASRRYHLDAERMSHLVDHML